MGFTSQLNTFNSVGTATFAAILSLITVRFKHKLLLLTGISIIVISAIGSFLASTLLSLQFFFALEGGGGIAIWIMASTMVGDYFPPEKKAKAISYILSIGFSVNFISLFLVGVTTEMGGWRANFLLFALPFSLTALVIASFVLPSKPRQNSVTIQEPPYLRSVKEIFSNRSAMACLIAEFLIVNMGQMTIFTIAFYRTRFSLPTQWTVGILEIAALIHVIAPIIAGRLSNRVGAKRISLVSMFSVTVCLISLFFIPNVYIFFVVDMLLAWFGTALMPTFYYLELEQVPKYRDVMMSLNSICNSLGGAVACAIGGALLIITEGAYHTVGLALGSMTLIGSIIFLFFAKDLTKTPLSHSNKKTTT
jgi:predicted MFS family arabinose efflux permease